MPSNEDNMAKGKGHKYFGVPFILIIFGNIFVLIEGWHIVNKYNYIYSQLS